MAIDLDLIKFEKQGTNCMISFTGLNTVTNVEQTLQVRVPLANLSSILGTMGNMSDAMAGTNTFSIDEITKTV